MANAVGRRTFELTEFLVDVRGITDLGASYHGRVTYHDSCHLLRPLGVRSQPRILLSNIRGLEFVEMADYDSLGHPSAIGLDNLEHGLHPGADSAYVAVRIVGFHF